MGILRTPARLAPPLKPGAFRLFLALLVFAHHCSSLGLGKYAVYVFFVLSGFWVHRMWVARYSVTHKPYLTYMASRLWRLLPVFLAVNVITIPLLVAIGIPSSTIWAQPIRLIASCLFILGYADLSYLPVGSGWSLDIEMQFYLIAPLVALALRGSGMVPVLIGLAIVSLVTGILLSGPVLPQFLGFFGAGMAASAIRWKPTRPQILASGLGTSLVLLATLVTPLRGIVLGGAHPGPLFAWNGPYNVIMAMMTIPYAIHTTHQPSDATDRGMADLSYVLYLLHWVAIQWLFTIGGSHMFRLAHIIVAWAVVLPGSWLIWRYIDHPINAARSRWVSSRTRSDARTVAGEVPGP